MNLIINGNDVTAVTGELVEIKGDVFLSLQFLENYKEVGVKVSKTAGEYRVDFEPAAVLKLLSKDNSFPAELSVGIETGKNGTLKVKAELGIGDFGKASIDQDGKIQAGMHIRF